MSKTTRKQYDEYSFLSNEELKFFYKKCKNYIHQIIKQQKNLGNEFKSNSELFDFLTNDPNTPEWIPRSRPNAKGKFKRLGSFSILDFTGIDTKFSNQRTSNEKEKLYIKCQKYAQKLVKKHKFSSEKELYNFTNNDPNTPLWYQPNLFRRLDYTIEDFTGIPNYTSSNRKWVSQEKLSIEIQKIISKRKIKNKVGKKSTYQKLVMFNKIKKFSEYKIDWPKTPWNIYENFKGLSFLLFGMTEDEFNYRFPIDVATDIAQILSKENNIRTIDEWSDIMITCGPIYGMPINPKNGFRKYENGKLLKDSTSWPGDSRWLGLDGPWKYERDYEKALLISVPFCKKNKIIDGASWDGFIKKFPNKIPETLSSVPDNFFRNLWEREKITKFTFHWGTWTGSGVISTIDKMKMWLPWPEAKIEYQRLAKQYGLKSGIDWFRFAKKNSKLLEKLRLPVDPTIYTRERVWRTEYGKKDI
jgi:hypothetical protein